MRLPAPATATLVVSALVGIMASEVDIPETARSRAAVKRVEPRLARQLAAKGLEPGRPIFLRIFKESSELEAFVERDGRFELFATYPICTYSGTLGPKLREGDGQSPEGFYVVGPRALNPASRFHLSFNLGFPNAYDRAHGRTGSFLMVHGDCVSIGCYAMTDAKIEEIYALADAALRNGQPFFRVHVFPFRLTDENLRRHSGSEWIEFWRSLQEGYAWFEQHGRPPDVRVEAGRYVLGAS